MTDLDTPQGGLEKAKAGSQPKDPKSVTIVTVYSPSEIMELYNKAMKKAKKLMEPLYRYVK